MNEEHIKLIDSLILSKLNSLPRAIRGKAPDTILENICYEIDLLKDIRNKIND